MKVKLLIADDDSDIVELLSHRCEAIGLEVETANNAMTALEKAEIGRPDAIILDVNMPYGNGLSVCEMMNGHDDMRKIPVIVLTGSTDDETIARCHQMSALHVPKGPGVWSLLEPLLQEVIEAKRRRGQGGAERTETTPEPSTVPGAEAEAVQSVEAVPAETDTPAPIELLDTVFALLSAEEGDSLLGEDNAEKVERRSDQPWVLSIEDDDDVALALRLRLKGHGIQVVRASAGKEGYRRAFMDKPRAILLDYELPQGNGDYVLRRLKESPTTADIPVIVLTGRKESSVERQMRGLGASEFLTKPFDWERLRAALDTHLDLENAGSAPVKSGEAERLTLAGTA